MTTAGRMSARELAALFGLATDTIHQWASRGRITRHPGGFDPVEVYSYLAGRNRADRARAARHLTPGHATVSIRPVPVCPKRVADAG